ncbi:MAG: hypothetical protein AAB467_01300 [Patescibacteria group bacterium]
MQISANLPQFKKGTALLVVSGDFEVDFYLATNGEIAKADSMLVGKTNPLITSGFVVNESGGSKNLKVARHAEFLNAFKKHLTYLLSKSAVEETHMFAPAEVKNELQAALPAKLKKCLKVYEGNFHKEHPFKLLEKIAFLPAE